MKLTKIILVPLIIAVIGSGAVLISNVNQEEPVQIEQSAVTFEREAVQSGDPVEVEEAKPTEAYVPSVAPAIDAKAVAEEPLSLLDYAKTQLNLSSPELENCFNMIVQEYPERFVGAEAHNNVKALKAYASVCSSGIMSKSGGHIYLWDRRKGHKGAFFDSDLAKSQH